MTTLTIARTPEGMTAEWMTEALRSNAEGRVDQHKSEQARHDRLGHARRETGRDRRVRSRAAVREHLEAGLGRRRMPGCHACTHESVP